MQITGWVLIATTVLLIGYDVWRVLKHDDSTISWTLYSFSKRYPILPFALGVLFGHLLWSQ